MAKLIRFATTLAKMGATLDIISNGRFHIIGAGGFIQVPSNPITEKDELFPFFQRYYRGTEVDAKTKTDLFQLAWELIGSP